MKGHDLMDKSGTIGKDWPIVGLHSNFNGHESKLQSGLKSKTSFGAPASLFVEGMFNREKEIYRDMCERWRNIPKPTIACVQGKVIAGGLMLIWPMDIIIAAENATFQDMTLAMGVCGVE